MTILRWRSPEWGYVAKAYGYLPITFLRRAVFGRDPYLRRFFWSRWGVVPADVMAALGGGPVIWIEAISGGEVTQIVSFCRSLRAALPGPRLLLATNNRYSYEFATATLAVDAVVDSPWDCRGPVRRALSTVAPRALVGVENLTSPVLFREARRRGVTTVLASGLMSKDFHRHPMMHRSMPWRPFDGLDWIGAKSEEDLSEPPTERFRLARRPDDFFFQELLPVMASDETGDTERFIALLRVAAKRGVAVPADRDEKRPLRQRRPSRRRVIERAQEAADSPVIATRLDGENSLADRRDKLLASESVTRLRVKSEPIQPRRRDHDGVEGKLAKLRNARVEVSANGFNLDIRTE
jgi:hypothetical protein